ncbi:MAG: S8 family serine peptidase [bacterium]
MSGLSAARCAAEVVSQAALARAARDGDAAVIVALNVPAASMGRSRAALLAELDGSGLVVEHVYTTVAGFSGRATSAALAQLAARADVARVDLDPIGTVASDHSIAHIRADRVQARDISGVGVTIAVIDSGIDASHPDLAGALEAEACFCRGGTASGISRQACCPDGSAQSSGPGSANSVDAHGPHVAGIALSRGLVAPRGVAPGAHLVAVRVLDDHNRGFLSDWIAALDWLAVEHPEVRVVNMSLVSAAVFSGDCGRCSGGNGCAANRLFADAIEQLWQRGTVVFAASGNGGQRDAMSAPACVSRAVAVGAVDAADNLAAFTNRSAGLDVLAPGVDIVSDGLDGGLSELSGTSMSSPHAAGAAALLLSARPGLSADALVGLLAGSGVPITDPSRLPVAPRIDAFAALRGAMRAPELVRGGGGRTTDCLLELSIIPPEAVRGGASPIVGCRDNDPLCDGDRILGRCTFEVSVCANVRDPLLRACRTDEALESFAFFAPRVDAPAGTIERQNADQLAFALPDFPFPGESTCSLSVPFVVERLRSDRPGVADIRMRVNTATRSDYDRVRFRCDPP